MPTYVYETVRTDGKPGRRFEIRQKITEPPLKKDPKTGRPLRRVIVPFAFLNNRFDKTVRFFEKKDRREAGIKKEEKSKKKRKARA
ncbi:MAG TPA: zinc ribbon domain-containing protein [Candidatus Omnitrophota bacterium]|nr:zinc ribbon domain-containing protein [Candidatus Omnitrophota bacterium]